MADASTPQAPGSLELVRRFVNTLDIEAGVDQLSDSDSWQRWLDSLGAGLTRHEYRDAADAPADDAALERARSLRESLRDGLAANHARDPLPPSTAADLTAAARWAAAQPRFTDAGLRLGTTATGLVVLIGDVLDATAVALAGGDWRRLKVCVADDCRWAFFDHSRSRTGRWCSMGGCGNRAKQSRWRDRRAD